MTERDKIANVLNSTEISQELSKEDIYKFADALIAAGLFADVRSLAEGNCVLYVKGKGFMRLYNEQDINRMIHRAEVAERALRSLAQLCAKGAKYYLQSNEAVKERERELYDEWIKQAEKEVEEENNAKN